MAVKYMIVAGDLLDQPVEVIVNAWNRNIIPWWLLRPHGVSGALKAVLVQSLSVSCEPMGTWPQARRC